MIYSGLRAWVSGEMDPMKGRRRRSQAKLDRMVVVPGLEVWWKVEGNLRAIFAASKAGTERELRGQTQERQGVFIRPGHGRHR